MKRLLCVALFLLCAAPLFAIQTNLIDDVIRMSRSHVADETIIEFVQTSRERISVTADDMIAMTSAGVSQAVINAVLEKAKTSAAPDAVPTQTQPSTAPAPDTTGQTPPPDEDGCLTFDPPGSLVFPFYGPFIPPQLWDPYWYQPRLDTRGGPPVSRAPVQQAAPPAVNRPSVESRSPRESGDRGSTSARAPRPAERSGDGGSPVAAQVAESGDRGSTGARGRRALRRRWLPCAPAAAAPHRAATHPGAESSPHLPQTRDGPLPRAPSAGAQN